MDELEIELQDIEKELQHLMALKKEKKNKLAGLNSVS